MQNDQVTRLLDELMSGDPEVASLCESASPDQHDRDEVITLAYIAVLNWCAKYKEEKSFPIDPAEVKKFFLRQVVLGFVTTFFFRQPRPDSVWIQAKRISEPNTPPVEDLYGWVFMAAADVPIENFVKQGCYKKIERLVQSVSKSIQRQRVRSREKNGFSHEYLTVTDATPEQAIIQRELSCALRDAIDALAGAEHELVYHRVIDGESFKVLSERTGRSPTTIKSEISGILARLRQTLEATGVTASDF